MTRGFLRRTAVALTALWAFAMATTVPHAGADDRPLAAIRARLSTLALALDDAATILDGASDDPDVVVERARLALYRGDCDAAAALLERPDLREHDTAAELAPIALGCARATAAAVVRRDPRGVLVRFQDAADTVLFPWVTDSALAIREVLARELGTRLPDPIFIDMVRDQLSLSALSGLPEKAAKTTGTVAVAKWGRVLILSPRAAPHGYGWLDTLAHEMTHLVLSQATRDRAPLWLQEGVAKRQEVRWRARHPFDGTPSADDVAATGMDRGLGLSLTKLGPSIAMLPSAEQAMVAFGQVSSFVAYWIDQAGEGALPKVLAAMRDGSPDQRPEEAIRTVTGASLDDWDQRWRTWLRSTPRAAPEEMMGGREVTAGKVVGFREVARKRRLAELLLERGHARAAEVEAMRAFDAMPTDAASRCMLADAWLAQARRESAAPLVASPRDIRNPTARWWSLHDHLGGGDALPNAASLAIGLDPYDDRVACEERPREDLPADPDRRALCIAARRRPWE